MSADPTDADRQWLKDRGMPVLFDALVARLLETRPDNCIDFLKKELEMFTPLSPAAMQCVAKMQSERIHECSIRAFLNNHKVVESGETGLIAESSIEPAADLAALDTLKGEADAALIEKTVVLKLNGGLGTGMGLSKAKSLLVVKDDNTFLDFIAKQVLHFRNQYKCKLRFMLMNSFSTSTDTREFLAKYAEFSGETFDKEIELMQSKVPKIDQKSHAPADHAADPDMEWTPPGHGELYTVLGSSGKLDALLEQGYEYMFVSNSDNLGATLDLNLLSYMATEKKDFVMEVCERTESDKKGGHLAKNKETGGLLLRESAQCAKDDEAEFQNIGKHKYFNTNNLWINLKALKECMNKHNNVLPLPVIRNGKTVNPTDAASQKVFQLENAMGTAIQLFQNAGAIVVPRSRFAPVKTCNDLLSLRSDCYEVTPDSRLILKESRQGVPPVVSLEDKHYKFVDQFEKLVADAVPSMVECKKVQIKGPVAFAKGSELKGEVTIVNEAEERKTASGSLEGEVKL